jgi:hypothetical protein
VIVVVLAIVITIVIYDHAVITIVNYDCKTVIAQATAVRFTDFVEDERKSKFNVNHKRN